MLTERLANRLEMDYRQTADGLTTDYRCSESTIPLLLWHEIITLDQMEDRKPCKFGFSSENCLESLVSFEGRIHFLSEICDHKTIRQSQRLLKNKPFKKDLIILHRTVVDLPQVRGQNGQIRPKMARNVRENLPL